MSGDCMTVTDNTCRNVNFGISVSGNTALISGNLVENFAGDTIADHNLLLRDADTLFMDSAQFDFHLRPDAIDAIDSGSSLLAPVIDLDGIARPPGSGVDLGCYER